MIVESYYFSIRGIKLVNVGGSVCLCFAVPMLIRAKECNSNHKYIEHRRTAPHFELIWAEVLLLSHGGFGTLEMPRVSKFRPHYLGYHKKHLDWFWYVDLPFTEASDKVTCLGCSCSMFSQRCSMSQIIRKDGVFELACLASLDTVPFSTSFLIVLRRL